MTDTPGGTEAGLTYLHSSVTVLGAKSPATRRTSAMFIPTRIGPIPSGVTVHGVPGVGAPGPRVGSEVGDADGVSPEALAFAAAVAVDVSCPDEGCRSTLQADATINATVNTWPVRTGWFRLPSQPWQRDSRADSVTGPGVVTNDVTAWLSANRPASGQAGASQSSLTSAIYINHFNIQIGDGWFGDSEMQFHSVAMDGPLTGWNGPSNQNPLVTGTCPLGSYYRNNVEEDRGYNGLFLLSSGEGITASFDGSPGGPAIVNCNSDGVGISWYAVAIKEDDGFATGGNDDFGWRFYVKPSDMLYPAWANVATSSEAASSAYVESFYRNTWDNERSAYLRIQFYP